MCAYTHHTAADGIGHRRWRLNRSLTRSTGGGAVCTRVMVPNRRRHACAICRTDARDVPTRVCVCAHIRRICVSSDHSSAGEQVFFGAPYSPATFPEEAIRPNRRRQRRDVQRRTHANRHLLLPCDDRRQNARSSQRTGRHRTSSFHFATRRPL